MCSSQSAIGWSGAQREAQYDRIRQISEQMAAVREQRLAEIDSHCIVLPSRPTRLRMDAYQFDRWGPDEHLGQIALPSLQTWAQAANCGNFGQRGTEIVASTQARQEVLVWTDSSLYSLQYVGAESGVWGATLVGEQISITSQNSVAYANGVAYWMGKDKFYKYDGRTQPLPCDLRKHVFSDFNPLQYNQVFGGSNEAFHEVWWFYCSANASDIDKYVVYNYLENIWYYGSMSRSAWLDSGLRSFPLAATYNSVLVDHENGIDDNETGTPAAISAFITSAEFDLEDGHQFALVSKMIPDVSFEGSTGNTPTINMTLSPLNSSGSGYNTPASESGVNTGAVVRSASVPVDVYTSEIYTRVRGRQMSMKIESSTTGVQWQLGYPRLDMRPDGRR